MNGMEDAHSAVHKEWEEVVYLFAIYDALIQYYLFCVGPSTSTIS
jgi:hypothetical protein